MQWDESELSHVYLAYTEAGDRLRLAAALGLKGAVSAAAKQQQKAAAGGSQQQKALATQERPATQRGPPGGGGAGNRERDRDREWDSRGDRDPRATGRRSGADEVLGPSDGGRRGGARDDRMMRDDRMSAGRQSRRGEREGAERDPRLGAGKSGSARGPVGFDDDEYADDYYGLLYIVNNVYRFFYTVHVCIL